MWREWKVTACVEFGSTGPLHMSSMFFIVFSRIWHVPSWANAFEVGALRLMLWLDYDVALKINNFPWPWLFLFSLHVLALICTRRQMTILPRLNSTDAPQRLGKTWWKTPNHIFTCVAKTRARKLTLGMRKLNSAADLESRTTAPWKLPNMERILVTRQIEHLVLERSLLNFLALFPSVFLHSFIYW